MKLFHQVMLIIALFVQTICNLITITLNVIITGFILIKLLVDLIYNRYELYRLHIESVLLKLSSK